LKNGPGLLEVAEDAMQRAKPLVLTKVGRTRAGARAIASHTGSLAGEDVVFDGVIRQRGIIRARSDEQILDFVDVFSQCALPAGKGIGFITRSGGAGAVVAPDRDGRETAGRGGDGDLRGDPRAPLQPGPRAGRERL